MGSVQIRNSWKQSPLGRSIQLLSSSERRKVIAVIVIQIFMSGLDLVAIGLVGILGSLAVTGVASRSPGGKVHFILNALQLNGLSFQSQVAALGVLATVLLLGRTFLSIFFTRRIMFFLSRRAAALSTTLISKLLGQSLLFIQGRTTQQTLFTLTQGVSSITLGIIGVAVSVIADLSLIFVMLVGLFVINPTISLTMLIVFGFIAVVLYKFMHGRATDLGNLYAQKEVKSSEKIVEVLSSYRETIVRNRRSYYANLIGSLRFQLADTQAELAFMPNISKYVMESAVILGSVVFAGIQFILTDATHAVGTLAIFLTAGTRVAPAALRLQQSAIQLKYTMGSAGPTLDLIDSLKDSLQLAESPSFIDYLHEGFDSSVRIRGLSLTYPGKEEPAISDANLDISQGSFVAIVGQSGAGKTTLVDVLLGVIFPDSGSITISGLEPLEAINKWPGAIGYVPQDVTISSGSIRENVALGFDETGIDDKTIWEALKIAQLDDFVLSLPCGLDTEVGERGTKLSGGQRQRLGVARAVFTKPKLLILDEATSALDGQTELDISEAIKSLKGQVSIVVIAHRLSTIRDADKVVYLSKGRIRATGTFEEVRIEEPEFDHQANIMGL